MRNILMFLTAIVLVVGLSIPAQAEIKSLSVKVDGLACPFCAYGLEKNLKKVAGAKEITIDVDKGTVTLHVEEGAQFQTESQPNEGLIYGIQKAVKKGGFTFRKLEAKVEGHVSAQNGKTLLKILGTEEEIVLEKSNIIDEFPKSGATQPIIVTGVVHTEASPLSFTIEGIVSPQQETSSAVRRLKISGIVCTGCIEAIQSGLKNHEGIQSIQVDLESGTAEIVVENDRISGKDLAEVVNTLSMEGMPAGTFKATVLEE